MRFGTRMMIAFTVLLALAFGAGGSLLIYTSTNNSLKQSREAAVNSHRLLLYTLSATRAGAPGSREPDRDGLIYILTQLDSQSGHNWVSLRLSDEGRVVYTSNKSEEFGDLLTDSADDEHYAMLMMRGADGAYLLRIAGRFERGDVSLCLESVYDISTVFEGRQYQEAIYRRLFLAVVALGAAASWLLSFLMTTPLRRLSRVTRTIASGDLSCRADSHGRDEIGILAADFNDMADRLETNITELRDTMRRQEEFMGGLAHELKTPMTSIIGYADLLRGHELSDGDRLDAANYIFSEGRRLEVLSLKLLDLIVLKRSDFTFIPVSPSHIIESAARLLRPVLQKHDIRLTWDCRGGVCQLEPDLIMSLLLNLIDNARKAIDSDGEIHINAFDDDCEYVIQITDNGRGVPEDELNKLKDAFYRVDKSRSRAQGGVGLGLRLCDEITALHGGRLTFESELGRGTTVTVRFKRGVDDAYMA